MIFSCKVGYNRIVLSEFQFFTSIIPLLINVEMMWRELLLHFGW